MSTHSSILSWEIPGTEDPGRSVGLQRIRHDFVAKQEQQTEYFVNKQRFF